MNFNQPFVSKRIVPVASFAAWSCLTVLVIGFTGCRGTAPSFSQMFGGLNAPARVPPPAQGSYQVPGSYSGGVGTSGATTNNGLGTSSFSNGMKTSQNTFPPSNLLNGISNAQSQILTASNNARNSVNRAADGINSSVEQASARVDRLNQGVTQAGAILTEAVNAPIVPADANQYSPNENATWRTPSSSQFVPQK
jgi:hypothetical protein